MSTKKIARNVTKSKKTTTKPAPSPLLPAANDLATAKLEIRRAGRDLMAVAVAVVAARPEALSPIARDALAGVFRTLAWAELRVDEATDKLERLGAFADAEGAR